MRADRLEKCDTLVALDLAVCLVFYDKARDVVDDRSDGLLMACVVLKSKADLGSGDAETPESLGGALNETTKGRRDLGVVDRQRVD